MGRTCLLGHRSRCFDVKCCEQFNLVLCGSEDGFALLWNLSSKKLLFKFVHNVETEVLRVGFLEKSALKVFTGGADGSVIIWEAENASNYKYTVKTCLRHEQTHQVYCCFQSPGYPVVVGVENKLCFWILNDSCGSNLIYEFAFIKSGSQMTSTQTETIMDEFSRVYIFDAKPNSSGSHIAVALSDGTLRVIAECSSRTSSSSNKGGKGFSVTLVIDFPSLFAKESDFGGSSSTMLQVTSVTWDCRDRFVLASLSSGHVALIEFETGHIVSLYSAHASTCYGALFYMQSDRRDTIFAEEITLISWSVDCTIAWWSLSLSLPSSHAAAVSLVSSASCGPDSKSSSSPKRRRTDEAQQSQRGVPKAWTCTGLSKTRCETISDFPILSCDIQTSTGIVVCAGGRGGNAALSFMGIPVYALDND